MGTNKYVKKANMKVFAVLALVAGAQCALELDQTTFDAEVMNSGKNAFVKFLAPW